MDNRVLVAVAEQRLPFQIVIAHQNVCHPEALGAEPLEPLQYLAQIFHLCPYHVVDDPRNARVDPDGLLFANRQIVVEVVQDSVDVAVLCTRGPAHRILSLGNSLRTLGPCIGHAAAHWQREKLPVVRSSHCSGA